MSLIYQCYYCCVSSTDGSGSLPATRSLKRAIYTEEIVQEEPQQVLNHKYILKYKKELFINDTKARHAELLERK